jgi:hypothetical protein
MLDAGQVIPESELGPINKEVRLAFPRLRRAAMAVSSKGGATGLGGKFGGVSVGAGSSLGGGFAVLESREPSSDDQNRRRWCFNLRHIGVMIAMAIRFKSSGNFVMES